MSTSSNRKSNPSAKEQQLWEELEELRCQEGEAPTDLDLELMSGSEGRPLLTREQWAHTSQALERYTVDMPTVEDTGRLLQRLALARESTDSAAQVDPAAPQVQTDPLERADAIVPDSDYELLFDHPQQQGVAPGSWAHLSQILRMVRTQTRLFTWPFWVVSAVLVLLGGVSGLFTEAGSLEPMVVVVPVLAVFSVCAAFRTFTTPMLELEMTMPITPAQLVYGRLVLIIGYDLVIAMLVSPIAASSGTKSLGLLIMNWLIPLAVVSLTALAAVLYLRPYAAAGISLMVWCFMLMTDSRFTAKPLLGFGGGTLSSEAMGLLYLLLVIGSAAGIHHKVRALAKQGGVH